MKYLLEGERTQRLLFRKFTPLDYTDWLPFHQNTASSQYWSGIPKDPKTACEQQFKGIFERYNNDQGAMNALVDNNTQALIGMCGLLVQEVDGTEELEIGYSILPKYWRSGYAYEAAKKCKELAFKKKWATHLISIIHIDNLPSQKVALKIGMQIDKTTTYKNNPVHIYRVDS